MVFSSSNETISLKIFFFSIWVFFHEHSRFTGQQSKGGRYLFNSPLPFPPASETLRHQSGDYCRELASAHSQQPDSNREALVSVRKSLTTTLRALILISRIQGIFLKLWHKNKDQNQLVKQRKGFLDLIISNV